MTWVDIETALTQARESLPPLSSEELAAKERGWALHFESFAGWMEEQEPNVRASARAYARSREWPELTRDETMILHWRLEAAEDAAAALAIVERVHGLSAPTLDEEDLLEWLLCDWWHLGGEPKIVDRILARAPRQTPPADSSDIDG